MQLLYLVALGDTRLLSAICRGGHREWEQWEGPDGDVEETGLKTGRGARGKVKNKPSPRPLFTVLDWRREAKLLSSQPFGEQGMKEERERERERERECVCVCVCVCEVKVKLEQLLCPLLSSPPLLASPFLSSPLRSPATPLPCFSSSPAVVLHWS